MARITDWDDAYANRAHIPGSDAIFARWAAHAQEYRDSADAEFDIAYGPGPRHRLDLFLPKGPPKGLLLYFHGGYWMAFDKSSSSHLAAGPTKRGWAMAIPSYDLCPQAGIAQIAQQIATATEAAAERVAGDIVLSGHSAGGHLAALLMSEGTAIGASLRTRIKRVVGISGLYDLRPLINCQMNQILGLDMANARALSPALLVPAAETQRDGFDLICWCGAEERPEFRRQNRLLANIWTGLGVKTEKVETPGQNHFTVIAPLCDPESPLSLAVTTPILAHHQK